MTDHASLIDALPRILGRLSAAVRRFILSRNSHRIRKFKPPVRGLNSRGIGSARDSVDCIDEHRPILLREQFCEIITHGRRIGMLGPEHLLIDRQSAPVERPRLFNIALGLKHGG
jgi:hypothetical protein